MNLARFDTKFLSKLYTPKGIVSLKFWFSLYYSLNKFYLTVDPCMILFSSISFGSFIAPFSVSDIRLLLNVSLRDSFTLLAAYSDFKRGMVKVWVSSEIGFVWSAYYYTGLSQYCSNSFGRALCNPLYETQDTFWSPLILKVWPAWHIGCTRWF